MQAIVERVKGFMLSKPRAQRVMIIAVALLLVSQFFRYFSDEGGGYLTNAMNTDYYTGIVFTGGRVQSGWSAHPLAVVFIAALGFMFLREDLAAKIGDRISPGLYVRYGYWIGVVLVFLSIVPGAPLRAFGATLGLAALAVAVLAAIMHGRARRAAPPGP